MRPSPPEPSVTRDGDELVVAAATAEAALATVHDRLGNDAKIVAADKVLSGGLWGFFPKEQVQIRARAADDGADDVEVRPARSARPTVAAPSQAPAGPAADSGGLAEVLASLASEEDDREEGLGAALRRHLGVTLEDEAQDDVEDEVGDRTEDRQPAPAMAASAAAGAAPAPTTGPDTPRWSPPSAAADAPRVRPAARPAEPDEAPPGASAPAFSVDDVEWRGRDGLAWSGRALLRLGLPRALVDAVLAQRPTDDASWVFALAQAVTPLCRPLPAGESVLVGPRAERLAKGLRVPLVRLSSRPKGSSTFAVAARDSRNARSWIAAHAGPRWLHLVAGGTDWRGWVFADPLAVSWVGHDTVGEALRTAHDLGLVLGYGLGDDGPVRATPVDVAVAVRAALEELR